MPRIIQLVEGSTIPKRNLSWITSTVVIPDSLGWRAKPRYIEPFPDDLPIAKKNLAWLPFTVTPPSNDTLVWHVKPRYVEPFNDDPVRVISQVIASQTTQIFDLSWKAKVKVQDEQLEDINRKRVNAALFSTVVTPVIDSLPWLVKKRAIDQDVELINKSSGNIVASTTFKDQLGWRHKLVVGEQYDELIAKVVKWGPQLLTPVVIPIDNLGWLRGSIRLDEINVFQTAVISWKPWMYAYTPPPPTHGKQRLLLLYVGR